MAIEERKIQSREIKEPTQELSIENRKKLKLGGVSDVESFSETAVLAETCMGRISIKGEGLKISKLNVDDGNLMIEGRINSLEYSKKKEKGSFFESIFR